MLPQGEKEKETIRKKEKRGSAELFIFWCTEFWDMNRSGSALRSSCKLRSWAAADWWAARRKVKSSEVSWESFVWVTWREEMGAVWGCM